MHEGDRVHRGLLMVREAPPQYQGGTPLRSRQADREACLSSGRSLLAFYHPVARRAPSSRHREGSVQGTHLAIDAGPAARRAGVIFCTYSSLVAHENERAAQKDQQASSLG